MSILLNTNGDTTKFRTGTYSKPYRSGNQQFRLHITFDENGIIILDHDEVITSNRGTVIKYKDFGQVLRIHEPGESNMLAYYSFFYADRLLHLCALTDDNISRKRVLNGSWRRENELVWPEQPKQEVISVSV